MDPAASPSPRTRAGRIAAAGRGRIPSAARTAASSARRAAAAGKRVAVCVGCGVFVSAWWGGGGGGRQQARRSPTQQRCCMLVCPVLCPLSAQVALALCMWLWQSLVKCMLHRKSMCLEPPQAMRREGAGRDAPLHPHPHPQTKLVHGASSPQPSCMTWRGVQPSARTSGPPAASPSTSAAAASARHSAEVAPACSHQPPCTVHCHTPPLGRQD